MCIRDSIDTIAKGLYEDSTDVFRALLAKLIEQPEETQTFEPVSYTHLDVYKRQILRERCDTKSRNVLRVNATLSIWSNPTVTCTCLLYTSQDQLRDEIRPRSALKGVLYWLRISLCPVI